MLNIKEDLPNKLNHNDKADNDLKLRNPSMLADKLGARYSLQKHKYVIVSWCLPCTT
jgi:hypothetical protein